MRAGAAAADLLDDGLVEGELGGGGLDDEGAREARGQGHREAGAGAGVAHHHLGEQGAQTLAVLGVEGISGGDEALLEVGGSGELTGLEQGDEVVELLEIGLHGGGGDEQEEAALELIDEAPAGGGAVLHVVGLVHGDEIPGGLGDEARMALQLGQVQGGDEDAGGEPGGGGVLGAEGGLLGGAGGDLELLAKLLGPLAHEGAGDEDEHPAGHAAQAHLLDEHAGFNGLAQPHFIGQQRPPAEQPEHLEDGLHLIVEALHAAQVRQAEQLVELLGQLQVPGGDAQLHIGQGARGRAEDAARTGSGHHGLRSSSLWRLRSFMRGTDLMSHPVIM